MKQSLRYLLVIGGAVAGVLMFLLTSASENTDFFERHFPWLLGINLVVGVVLFGLVVLLLLRLIGRYRSHQFGSRLMLRMVLPFAAAGILPGVIFYAVSVQFVSRSIETWFDVSVDKGLMSGVQLGQAIIEDAQQELRRKAHDMALELADLPQSRQSTLLSRQRDDNHLQEATIIDASGRVLLSASGSLSNLLPALAAPPQAAMLREARTRNGYADLLGDTDAQESLTFANSGKNTRIVRKAREHVEAAPDFRVRVLVEIPQSLSNSSLTAQGRYLQLVKAIPKDLAINAQVVASAFKDYGAISSHRSGLRIIYIAILTVTLLLTIFGAIASAFLIASKLAKPLLLLAEGTRAVADGDLSPRPIIATDDELGTLTRSFNTMTHQLLEARTSVEKNRADLEHAKARLESVLANMSAGVMVLDGNFVLVTYNQSVERILQHGFADHLGQPLATIDGLSPFVDAITRAFSEQSAQSVAEGFSLQSSHWQKQIEIPRNIGGTDTDHDITLLTRGSRLPVQNGTGYILVFDDISGLISAERSIAWGEVARRLAHEIKNPLTPIQLSAERLQMKLQDKLAAGDLELLSKGTSTIVSQVSAMKRMVDDFRDYAKTPPAILSPLDLNSLIAEILNLYIGGDERDVIHVHLGADLPFVMGDPTQLRQVIHNLLQNAQDATLEKHKGTSLARIDVITELIHYPNADGSPGTAVRLSVEDNGPGFAPHILARAFEPYVTSKSRGTGLGLAMVKKIIDEHGGRIDIHNRQDANGAQVLILLLKLAPR